MPMTHLGLFEGIGGFSLAARWAGWTTPVMVEWNPYCQAVLRKNFPDATIFGDIHEFDGRPYAGQVDIITGGFPCQPYSHAGLRAGNDDDRALWPQMLRVIQEVAPEWIVGENVAGLLSMDGGRVFAGILADLENAWYSTETYLIPAISVGAPHRRDRVWIVAHRDHIERDRRGGAWNGRPESANEDSGHTSDACQPGLQGGEQCGTFRKGSRPSRSTTKQDCNGWSEHWYEVATRICGMDDGLPAGLDGIGGVPAKTKTKAGKAHRLEALGNAIVPEIAYQIFDAINKYNP